MQGNGLPEVEYKKYEEDEQNDQNRYSPRPRHVALVSHINLIAGLRLDIVITLITIVRAEILQKVFCKLGKNYICGRGCSTITQRVFRLRVCVNMAAVIRVKRRVDEDPLEAFVLNSKRRKAETHTDKDEVSTILKFAGTVQNQVTACLQQQCRAVSGGSCKECACSSSGSG